MSILIVEDEEDNIELLTEILQNKGYQYKFAKNGKSALELLQKTKFDLIILDISLPEMSGVDVIKFLKKKYPNSAIPILVITGSLGTLNKDTLSDYGVKNFLKKPIKIDQFLEIIDCFIK